MDIVINEDDPDTRQLLAVTHEVTHAIDVINKLGFQTRPDNEHIVHALACYIFYDVLPAILKWAHIHGHFPNTEDETSYPLIDLVERGITNLADRLRLPIARRAARLIANEALYEVIPSVLRYASKHNIVL
jgi:hypothetical protein